jgi:hypothetical protein
VPDLAVLCCVLWLCCVVNDKHRITSIIEFMALFLEKVDISHFLILSVPLDTYEINCGPIPPQVD